MILTLYSIKDELSEFAVPFPAQDDANAKRYFRYQVETTKIMNDNPEDFSLWKIGTFDTKEGNIVGLVFPELVERAKGATNNGNEETTV